MYERVLLANDGSDFSAAAVPHAAALARAVGSDVLVVRVSRGAGEALDALTPTAWTRQIERGDAEVPGEERAEAYPPLSQTVAALYEAGVERAGSIVVRGDPGEAIVEAASRFACSAIVISSRGLSGLRRAVLGSVADHVVRHSPGIPVLLCPPPSEVGRGEYRRLLVALDGSEVSDSLLPHAREIALASGATMVLVRVIDSAFRIVTMTTPAGYPLTPGLTQEAADEIVQAQRSTADEHLDGVVSALRGEGVGTVTARVVEGEPGDAIVALAEELDSDLVLMATHGRGGLGRALVGSVTDYVARHLATAPALIVPPERG